MSSGLALGALDQPLDPKSRHAVRGTLRALLSWQRRLTRWPRLGAAPDATPIISLYANGRLLGCCANAEGRPGERLARAFLLALGDPRFGGIEPAARRRLVAQIAYPHKIRRVSLDAAPRVLAPGAHGLALSVAGRIPTLLIPDAAREHELDAEGLLGALERKAGLLRDGWPLDGLSLFTTERVVARSSPEPLQVRAPDAMTAAVRWLARRVAPSGSVAFGHNPREGRDVPSGKMLHGRAAVVIQALASHPDGQSAARRARRWLEREVRAGLGTKSPNDWPTDGAEVLGTLALAKVAGLPVGPALVELARRADLERAPWHAAQVAWALGRDTPEALWRACVRSLDRDPLAPWVAMAAAARGDTQLFERVALDIAAQVRDYGPHRGAVGVIPELALTALTIEALAPCLYAPVRRARDLACAFLAAQQIHDDWLPEVNHPVRALGAFPLTPIHSFLRTDVTAHAVLALHACG
ncbi:MAG TPA: AMMECR1 domain-containing protein [Polyangiaceae bacterium]